METHCILIKNNATSRKELWNIWQRTTCNSESPYKVKIIHTRCHREIQSLDRLWKYQIFQRTTQVKWTASKMVSKVAEL